MASLLTHVRDARQALKNLSDHDIAEETIVSPLRKTINAADAIITKVKGIMVKEAQVAVTKATSELLAQIELQIDGTPWHAATGKDKNLADYMQFCEGTIMNISPELVSADKKKHNEVARSTHGQFRSLAEVHVACKHGTPLLVFGACGRIRAMAPLACVRMRCRHAVRVAISASRSRGVHVALQVAWLLRRGDPGGSAE